MQCHPRRDIEAQQGMIRVARNQIIHPEPGNNESGEVVNLFMVGGGVLFAGFLRTIASFAFAGLLFLGGCTGLPERRPVPPEMTNHARIEGVAEARFWANEWPRFSLERFEKLSDEALQRQFPGIYATSHHYLAISGGGANGAFGAGLLAGWTEAGTRPQFTMVTGISTGALTAPFAFLGPKYDPQLKRLYTTIRTRDIIEERWKIVALFSDAMADTKPLRRLIENYVTAEVLEEIGREHRRGRRLLIGTVNLDAGRSVIWNLGAIAVSDYPRKLALVHDILQASSAIPVAFPPVVIPVDVGGREYDEMHVDGGTGSQVFIYPAVIDWKRIMKRLKVKGVPKVYVLRNAFLEPDYRGVNRSVLPIASRSISSLIRTQGIGDLYHIYALCQRDDLDFNLAYIPSTFTEPSKEGFDPLYMRKLYRLGYEMALSGYPWEKTPPGFDLKKAAGRE